MLDSALSWVLDSDPTNAAPWLVVCWWAFFRFFVPSVPNGCGLHYLWYGQITGYEAFTSSGLRQWFGHTTINPWTRAITLNNNSSGRIGISSGRISTLFSQYSYCNSSERKHTKQTQPTSIVFLYTWLTLTLDSPHTQAGWRPCTLWTSSWTLR